LEKEGLDVIPLKLRHSKCWGRAAYVT
jgi:hypothetical protein